jgi:hypothetical protein
MTPASLTFNACVLSAALAAGCAVSPSGFPVRGALGSQFLETRVDSEVARYYLASYLSGKRGDRRLDARIDGAYQDYSSVLPSRNELKRLSEEFSIDFAALYFADRVSNEPMSRRFRQDFEKARDYVRRPISAGGGIRFSEAAEEFEIIFVPGYLYRRHPATGADFAAPRATLKQVGFLHYFIDTDEDGPIEANADLVLAALRARSRAHRRVIVVSASKSGPEVALALTKLGTLESRRVAAWINIVGTLQGTPLADEKLWQEMEDSIGQVDIAGVESLTTEQSRRRFDHFRIPKHVFVVNYIGIPLMGSVSSLAQSGFQRLRKHGPNDGLSLLSDLIFPGGLTLAELGRDHFLLDDEIGITTLALTMTIIRWLEKNQTNASAARAGKSRSGSGSTALRPLPE